MGLSGRSFRWPRPGISAGDSVLFALGYSSTDREPCFIKGGDSVRVVLTDVADLGSIDPATGQALVQLTWGPPGQLGRRTPPRGTW